MDQRKFSFGILLLCCAVLLPLLAACAGSKQEEGGETTSGETRESGIPMQSLTGYTIVYAMGEKNKALTAALTELQTAIAKRCGVELPVSDDFMKQGTAPAECEILIGGTNRPESAQVCGELVKTDDYEIRLCGKKLVIAGATEESLLSAVRAFAELLPSADSAWFFEPSMQLSVKGDYELDRLLLNGCDITEYTVVYENNSACKKIAERISGRITERTGYRMRTVSAKSTDKIGKNILVGNQTGFPLPDAVNGQTSGDLFYAGNFGGNVYLWGADIPAVSRAAERFLGALNAVEPSASEMTVGDGLVLSADTSITSMSFNLLVNNVTEERVARVVAMIRKHMPDTLGVQEASEAWMQALSEALAPEYAFVGVGRDRGGKGETSAVFYRKDLYTVFESGTKWMSDTPDRVSKLEGSLHNRVFTYAVLERKSDGARWVHINTHTDHAGDDSVRLKQVQILMDFAKRFSGMPVLISGDFNNTEHTPSIEYILSQGMEDSAKTALKGDFSPTFKNRTIDFIFVSEGDFTVYEHVVDSSEIDGEKPSDHCPILTRFDLNR